MRWRLILISPESRGENYKMKLEMGKYIARSLGPITMCYLMSSRYDYHVHVWENAD